MFVVLGLGVLFAGVDYGRGTEVLRSFQPGLEVCSVFFVEVWVFVVGNGLICGAHEKRVSGWVW